jgi:hypothetical protein
MAGEFSEDGKWQWNGSEWIPAPDNYHTNGNEEHLISKQHTAIKLHDSVIAGDVTIHQADAHEIAKVVHDSGRCPTCGNANTATISCESVNCQSVFCFQCMQKYIHGRTIIKNKLCEKHHKSEINCLSLDDDFEHWEAQVKLQLTSLKYSESLIKNAPIIRPIGTVTGIGVAVIGFVDDPMLIGLGAIISISALFFPNIMTVIIGGYSKKLALLKQKIPQTTPHERPIIAGRSLPNFTEGSVREFLYDNS